MQWKIAILIIVLAGNVSCIRNANGNDKQRISVKLKNFFPSEPLLNEGATKEGPPQISARVTSSSGFRPSQMLEFTPSDVMPSGGLNRYPPSYLAPNYQHQFPSSLKQSPAAMDKQFSFPEESSGGYNQQLGSTPIPTTPIVSYLDPYTQQNYGYVQTATPPTVIQYQREQPDDDQVYTVQSSLLVGSHQPQPQRPRPGFVDDVYLKRPGYVFDESPASAVYRRPTKAPPALPAPPTTASHKISYDSHDYPPPSYAAEQTSNFVPQTLPERPLYNRQDINDNRAEAQRPQHQSRPPPSTSNYANNFDNYLQRPPPSYQGQSQSQSPSQSYAQPQSQSQSQLGGSSPTHYQYEPLARPQPGVGHGQGPRPGHNYYEYQIGEIPPPQSQLGQRPSQYPNQYQYQQQQQFNYRPGAGPTTYRPSQSSGSGGGGGGLATLASLFSSTQQYAPQFTNLLLGGGGGTASQSQSSPLGSLLGAFAGNGYQQQQQQHQYQKPQQGRPPNTQLIRALENIARNDDLECVPKVLCQMIAGQTLRGQLPGFITSPAIANFLTGFPVASPALIYGRAALLGLSGGERSCLQSYEKCPKNEMEIIHYLNNHRGGFFKFFSEPEEQPVAAQQSEGGASSFFSILSALTGGGGGQSQVYTTPRPVAPRPRPTQRPSTDIASGIGSFFSQLLSEYLNGVEYQRRRRRRRRSLLPTEIKRAIQTDDASLMPVDFHDEEDSLDTQSGRMVKFQDDDEAEAAQAHTELIGVLQFPEDEGRVVNFKDIESEEVEQYQDGAIRFPDATPAEAQRNDQSKIIREFNRDAAQRKLRFPQEREEEAEAEAEADGAVRQAKHLALMEGWRAVLPNGLNEADYGVDKRRGKRIVFRDTNEELDEQAANEERYREEQQREAEEMIREERIRVEHLRAERVREDELKVERIREIQLREQQLRDAPERYPLNAVYEEAAPPQRGARVIFPDHYERYIRKGKILNRPTYAPSYEYSDRREEKEDRFVLSNEHRPGAHYRLEAGDYPQPNTLNQGEYMPSSSTVRFGEPSNGPPAPQYNYPNVNYIGDNRYGSRPSQKPRYEDDKNIYVTNSQGVNEYYIRPDGSKVYLRAG
ncbi:uncharacterized protein LOC117580373 [Drosophila guanche]|uniref:uncharacterized protein LOC117580373 n=1 Tax=Drosophila guanche TaxID=7266 RepID=UPI00147128EC|nr:uncharacterized protein LOC117580373 [Drosophila guanche]